MRDSGEVDVEVGGAMAALPCPTGSIGAVEEEHKCVRACVPMDKAGRRAVRCGVFEVLIVWACRSGPAASQRNHCSWASSHWAVSPVKKR
jgi:hypothetical protein